MNGILLLCVLSAEPAYDSNAVVRIKAGDFGGTGTLIAIDPDTKQGLYLTCAHVADGGKPYKIVFAHAPKHPQPAKLIDIHRGMDCAVLTAPVADGIQPIPLDATWQPFGIGVSHGGYGRNRFDRAIVHGYQVSGGTTPDSIEVSGESVSGDSGGPIIRDGKLIGVLRGGPLDKPHNQGGKMLATQGAGGPGIDWLLRRKTFGLLPWARNR